MLIQSSRLCNLPINVLENITVEVTAIDPLGPPKDLVPLLQTCQFVYNALCFDNNKHLYARIFRCRFDTRAALRRFSPRAHYSGNLASQLRVYSAALKHIRQGDIRSPTTELDLWAAFFLMAESDGRNEAHLAWAGLPAYVDRFVKELLWVDREKHNGWPSERADSALALWLMWATSDTESLANESPNDRQQIMELVRPYVVAPFRYPSFHAPDNHFDFPLSTWYRDHLPYLLSTPHGMYPPYRQPDALSSTVVHYDIEFKLAPPPISATAKLIYFSRTEAVTFPIPDTLPVDREHAIAEGITHVSPTQEDFRLFNSHKAVRLLEKGDWDWRSKLNEEEGKLEDDGVWRKQLKSKSSKLDNDWHRWRYCFNPWEGDALKGVVYTFGSLNGQWAGRMLVPDNIQFFQMVRNPEFVPHVPAMTTLPISFRLREHHCINPEYPADSGGNGEDPIDDGIMNAWFPHGAEIREQRGVVRVIDRAGELTSRYETFREGRPNSHNEATCTQCIDRRERETRELEERVRENQRRSSEPENEPDSDDSASPSSSSRSSSGSPPPPEQKDPITELVLPRVRHVARPSSSRADIDDARAVTQAALGAAVDVDELLDVEMRSAEDEDEDEEWDEFVDNECNGIQDIIITGETLPKHSQAWHKYRFYGRVRRWDGLIALVRTPVDFPDLGVNIFRGYLHANETFVGHWRAVATTVQAIPYEGPFVASRAPGLE